MYFFKSTFLQNKTYQVVLKIKIIPLDINASKTFNSYLVLRWTNTYFAKKKIKNINIFFYIIKNDILYKLINTNLI